jgi:hypothetical protein
MAAARSAKNIRYEVFDLEKNALDGKAIRKQVTIHFSQTKDGPKEDLLIYIPRVLASRAGNSLAELFRQPHLDRRSGVSLQRSGTREHTKNNRPPTSHAGAARTWLKRLWPADSRLRPSAIRTSSRTSRGIVSGIRAVLQAGRPSRADDWERSEHGPSV